MFGSASTSAGYELAAARGVWAAVSAGVDAVIAGHEREEGARVG